ncbi:MAG: hypothetical protein CL613_07570 [Aquimarina sp.]|nr:hypothetical protein [Aquimarina sp.]
MAFLNKRITFISLLLLIPVIIFFSLTGDATFRYGAVYLQPQLINDAIEIANKDPEVKSEFGEIAPTDIFRLLEGEVYYPQSTSQVKLTIGLRNTLDKKAKLDIVASKKNEIWEYHKITVRIKKPEKKRIIVL